MAVGEVMHHLPHGPATVAIGCIELDIGQIEHSGVKLRWELTQRLKVPGAGGGIVRDRPAEAADRVAEVVQFCHGKNISTAAGPMHEMAGSKGYTLEPLALCGPSAEDSKTCDGDEL